MTLLECLIVPDRLSVGWWGGRGEKLWTPKTLNTGETTETAWMMKTVESQKENGVCCAKIFQACQNERILKTMTLHAHAEALYAGIRSLLGQHDASHVQAKLARELRHMIPTWSEARPDCPGWYWFKPPGVNEPQLLHVGHGRIDTKLMADLGPPNNLVDVQRVKGQWAGPILPPT